MIDLKLNKRILLVEGSNHAQIEYLVNASNELVWFKKGYLSGYEKLPSGNWEQPIKASEVTEEIAKEIMPCLTLQEVDMDKNPIGEPAFTYWDDLKAFNTALPCFQSLLHHHSLSPDKTILIIEK